MILFGEDAGAAAPQSVVRLRQLRFSAYKANKVLAIGFSLMIAQKRQDIINRNGAFGSELQEKRSVGAVDRFDLQPYDHGNYFPGLMTAGRLDDRSAQYVAQFIGASVATTPSANQILVNRLAPPNEIGTRTIGL